MALKSIRHEKRRLADEAYAQILAAILNEEIGAKDRLVQEKLAAELQISRTPVREALLRLEQDGVLVSSPRGGFMLHRMTEEEVRELYQARAAIEGQAARIVAARRDAARIAQLRKVIAREEKIETRTLQAYFEANRNIHRAVVELSDNRYLLEMFDNIWNRGVSFRLFSAIEKVDLAQSLGAHMALVDAMETGDVTVALEATIAHVQEGFELQLEALACAQPETGAAAGTSRPEAG